MECAEKSNEQIFSDVYLSLSSFHSTISLFCNKEEAKGARKEQKEGDKVKTQGKLAKKRMMKKMK